MTEEGVTGGIGYYMQIHYPVTPTKLVEGGIEYWKVTTSWLPGVEGYGDTAFQALEDFQGNKREWFLTCLDKGIEIPIPISC
ncbi:hypothetical protein GPK34_00225 [Secundilactobacillus kimchicus]|uniref:hypothetical protein n=1 Tax=Secundilactobacillus kimchicus TaxID=528209 RepID=UPI001C0321C3|nr:hypothetical protein [Secundilactobacillus kimchicus]MBT9670462.1 hypothetical protein [Secundilactobacillus kimchicus]